MSDPADELIDALQDATGVLTGIAMHSVEIEGEGLSLAQYRVLAVLHYMGESRTGRVAMMLSVDASTITRLADRLVSTGHVERGADPGHRGHVMLRLTSAGKDLVDRVRGWRRKELGRVLMVLDAAQRDVCVTALRAFTLAAGEGYGPPGGRGIP